MCLLTTDWYIFYQQLSDCCEYGLFVYEVSSLTSDTFIHFLWNTYIIDA